MSDKAFHGVIIRKFAPEQKTMLLSEAAKHFATSNVNMMRAIKHIGGCCVQIQMGFKITTYIFVEKLPDIKRYIDEQRERRYNCVRNKA